MQPRIHIKHTMEKLASHSRLILIGELKNFMQLKTRLNNLDIVYCNTRTFTHSDILFSMMGLLSIGKPNFDAIEIFRSKQEFFRKALKILGCPYSPTIRQRIDLIGQATDNIIKAESALLIRSKAPSVSAIKTIIV